MAWHLYLVPILGGGTSAEDFRRAKYISGSGVTFSMVSYGFQAIGLVAANVDAATDTALQSNSDVTKIPDNLDAQVAGALATVQAALENRNLPGNWVVSTTTYRTIIRLVIAVSGLLMRYAWLTESIEAVISGAVTLNTTFGSLPLAVRQKLQEAAVQLGIDTSGFTSASTLRQILQGVADQKAQVQTVLGAVVI